MRLTDLTRELSRLRDVPAAERRDGVAALLPALRDMLSKGDVIEDAQQRLVGRALRHVSPRQPLPATPAETLAVLEELLAAERGPGQPAIGPERGLRLPKEVWKEVDDEALRAGLIRPNGDPKWSDLVRGFVYNGLRALQQEREKETEGETL